MIGDKTVSSLKEVLRLNNTLIKLDFGRITAFICIFLKEILDNKIGDNGIRAIAKGLKFNSSIENLYLNCKNLFKTVSV